MDHCIWISQFIMTSSKDFVDNFIVVQIQWALVCNNLLLTL